METKNTNDFPLIETSELAALLKNRPENLTIIDANMKPEEYDKSFKNERIPGARFINIKEIGDQSKGLPNMLPTPEQFNSLLQDLDIGINDHIVCYADDSIYNATRIYWMFKVFGFPNVHVLNGTFPKWKKEEHPIETGEETWKQNRRQRTDADFKFVFDSSKVAYLRDIKKFLEKKEGILFDARPSKMYEGEQGNPRTGHIPGAISMPFTEMVGEFGAYKNKDEILEVFKSKGIDLSKTIRSSCGSGMTASALYVALVIAGVKNLALFDGSFTEWAKDESNPVEQGPSSTKA